MDKSFISSHMCCSCGKEYCIKCGYCFTQGCSCYNKGIGCSYCQSYKDSLKLNNNPLEAEKMEHKATYKKLNNGAWAVMTTDNSLKSGYLVEVHKADGSTSTEYIDKYHSTKKFWNKDHEIVEKYIYTIQKKYKKGGYNPTEQTEQSNNKPSYKKSYSHKSTSKHVECYNLIVWQLDSNTKKYNIITEMPNVSAEVVTPLHDFYKDNPNFVLVAQNIHNTDYYTEVVYCDIYTNSKELASKLLQSYHAKKEAQANLEKTWIMCTMGCKDFPARGQKIKGILGLSDTIKSMVEYKKIFNATVVSENVDIENVIHKHSTKNCRVKLEDAIPSVVGKFMRPVPKVPKHGFVDSRKVNSKEDVLKVIDEIRATGETPEFIALPFIDCSYSAVITPDNIALGKGHDGATQGNGAYVLSMEVGDEQRDSLNNLFWNVDEFYCPNCLFSYNRDYATGLGFKCIDPSCNNESLIRKWPYVEALYESQHTYPTVVQLRSGPEMKIESESIKVKKVVQIDSNMDLLEWDKLAHQLKGEIENSPNGKYSRICPVVWHPGGAYTSHFGVHCKDNKLPYITSNESPKEGDVIAIGVKNETNMEAFREGLVLGLETFIARSEDNGSGTGSGVKRDLKNFLAALHGYALLDLGNPEVARFVGYSFAVGARVVSALPFGECVHKSETKKSTAVFIGQELKHERDYAPIWKMDLESVVKGLVVCRDGFVDYKWASAYGGKAWAKCTESVIDIFLAMRDFLKGYNQENLSKIVEKINYMVNLAHNTGWFLNKLASKEDFDKAHKLPHFSFNPDLAFRLREEYAKCGKFGLKVKAFALAKKVDVEKLLAGGVLEVKAKDKLVQETVKAVWAHTATKPIVIVEKPLSQAEIKALRISGSEIKIQFIANMSGVHFQVRCYYINRDYGLSGSWSWCEQVLEDSQKTDMIDLFEDEKGLGKLVGSLTGSANQYAETAVYRSKKEGYVVLASKDDYMHIEDKVLAKEMRKIREWQLKEGLLSTPLLEKSKDLSEGEQENA